MSLKSQKEGPPPDAKILIKHGYSIGKKLGEGAYAKVYISTYTNPKTKATTKLACKVIDGTKAPPEFLEKFFPREIEAMRRVHHPNLIKIHSILQRKANYYLFMQFADKGDLLDFIRERGAIREPQAKIWFKQLTNGMMYMHGLNLCHRDLKCENVLLSGGYVCKISDFGFAREFKTGTALSETFCGSISYAPPEIIRGIAYDPLKADCWSLAVILFVMLNRGMPFDDSNLEKMWNQQMNRDWKIRRKVAGNLSNEVKELLQLMIEPDPKKRFSAKQINSHKWFK